MVEMITGQANTSTGRLAATHFGFIPPPPSGRSGSCLFFVSSPTTPSASALTMATMTKTADQAADPSFLDKLDQLVPQPLAQFDAFPKLPASYKARSESRGFLTVFVAFLAFLLVLNDLGEFIWGWPDFEFGVENLASGSQNLGASTLDINVDLVVNMPCQCESSLYLLLAVCFPRTRASLDVTQTIR